MSASRPEPPLPSPALRRSGLTETMSTARATSRSPSIQRKCGSTSAGQPICSPAIAPELEHTCVHLASRYSSIAAMCPRVPAIGLHCRELVGHLRLRRQPSALLHRLGDGSDFLRARRGRAGVCRPLMFCTCSRYMPATPRRRGRRRDRSHDRRDNSAAIDVRSDVPARVADEGGGGDRRRQAAVRDLTGKRLHLGAVAATYTAAPHASHRPVGPGRRRSTSPRRRTVPANTGRSTASRI
jgi:hypothetical protein